MCDVGSGFTRPETEHNFELKLIGIEFFRSKVELIALKIY